MTSKPKRPCWIATSRALAAVLITAAPGVFGILVAPEASAVTGCSVNANTDFRAYAQCSGGKGEFRAGAGCAVRGFFVGEAHGQWVKAGKVSVADCGAPFKQIKKNNGRPNVWWETRG